MNQTIDGLFDSRMVVKGARGAQCTEEMTALKIKNVRSYLNVVTQKANNEEAICSDWRSDCLNWSISLFTRLIHVAAPDKQSGRYVTPLEFKYCTSHFQIAAGLQNITLTAPS